SQEVNTTLANEYPARVVQPVSSSAARNVYFNYSGTSFSAPVVAGTVALMLDANKSLTPTLVKSILIKTAQALPGYSSKYQSVFSQGAGLVNAAAAVGFARAVAPNANHLVAGSEIFRGNETLKSFAPTRIGGEN